MPTARTVPELLDYHARSIVALRVLGVAIDELAEAERRRFPRRREGIDEVLGAMRDELDDEVVLAVVASAERVLRLDARARLSGTGAAAVRLRGLDERFQGHIPLEEIIDIWKDLAAAAHEGGAFKQIYIYRHGLAHGRYFNKSGLDRTTPRDAADVVDVLFTKIRTFAADFPLP